MEQIYPSVVVTTALANKFPTLILNRKIHCHVTTTVRFRQLNCTKGCAVNARFEPSFNHTIFSESVGSNTKNYNLLRYNFKVHSPIARSSITTNMFKVSNKISYGVLIYCIHATRPIFLTRFYLIYLSRDICNIM
jgi:hypothetical protein